MMMVQINMENPITIISLQETLRRGLTVSLQGNMEGDRV